MAREDQRWRPRYQRRLGAALSGLLGGPSARALAAAGTRGEKDTGAAGVGPPHGGDAHRPTATGVHGMVACAHPLAAQAGFRILQQGGNAIDAGVAVAAALNVVEPFMSGVGGGGFMQIRHIASGEHNCIDYTGVVPAAAKYDLYKDNADLQNAGPLSPTVPGSAMGWLVALERYGTLSAATVFGPAIELCERGFGMTKKGSEFFAAAFRVMDANSQPFRAPEFSAAEKTYMRADGTVPELGDLLKQPELGATFRALASEGPDVFYKGEIAEKIVGHVQKNGGIITMEDMAAYKPRWLTPLASTYRGYKITCVPPPNHGIQVLEALNILEGFPIGTEGWEHNSANTLHSFIEAMKLAASDRALNVHTSEDTPTAELVSKEFAAARRAAIDPERATPCPTDGARYLDQCSTSASSAGPRMEPANAMAWFEKQGSTTHFDVIDAAGNAFGCTHSLGSGFGSGVTVPGTGVTLNNFMRWTDMNPGNPVAAQPGDVASNGDISCMSPLFIFDSEPDGGSLRWLLGTPGSYGIPQTQTQLVMNVLDFGYDMQAAIEQPRVRLPETGAGSPPASELAVTTEKRIDEAVRDELTARGHEIELQEDWTAAVGGMQGIAIHPTSGVFMGGADPRRDGYAIGW